MSDIVIAKNYQPSMLNISILTRSNEFVNHVPVPRLIFIVCLIDYTINLSYEVNIYNAQ